ncbi:hypothetical protein C6P45_002638 [Maudiozyma exigua]|uniref:RING-type domain-containing protein n=1 Tax=Maudiozyma exigua TaxID=34358 RepID=A0A9P7B397_MAUEX|nr:hypothetical protein C6P45_002638 [Kazachstania exigua]
MNTSYRILIDLLEDTNLQNISELFINDSLFQHTEEHTTNSITRNITKDWRESDILIQTVQMNAFSSSEDKDSLVSKYLGHGMIRLFKLSDTESSHNENEIIVPGDDTMVSILFVPTYFTVHDLLHFYIGDDIINNQITNFRILKNVDGAIGLNFMVLMKFKDNLNAKIFKDNFNGKRFSKMDPEKCHVVSIKEIVFRNNLFQNEKFSTSQYNIPYLMRDPFTMNGYNDTERTKSDIELPTCPVCLERMDSQTTGLITIPCQHTFHCQCLDKWKNSRCPVCRFSSFRLSRDSLLKQMGDSPKCNTCDSHDNLWVCLVCGNMGCGRYNSKHAIQHFENTSHCFAMDIKTQRVWDYAGDNYVHRLVQNEIDGKLVEVGLNMDHSLQVRNSQENGNSSTNANEKDSDMLTEFMRQKEYHLEYVQVLVSQLESQREYYEEKLKEKGSEETTQQLKQKVYSLNKQLQAQTQSTIDRERLIQNKLDELTLMLKGVRENLDEKNKQIERSEQNVKKLTNEKRDLEEQVKDLMFFLETQEKFKDATEEERNGALIIKDPNANSSSKNKKKKKKHKVKIPTLEEIQNSKK